MAKILHLKLIQSVEKVFWTFPIKNWWKISEIMDLEEYREQGKKVVDFIYEYYKDYDQRPVLPSDDVKKGFLNGVISGK